MESPINGSHRSPRPQSTNKRLSPFAPHSQKLGIAMHIDTWIRRVWNLNSYVTCVTKPKKYRIFGVNVAKTIKKLVNCRFSCNSTPKWDSDQNIMMLWKKSQIIWKKMPAAQKIFYKPRKEYSLCWLYFWERDVCSNVLLEGKLGDSSMSIRKQLPSIVFHVPGMFLLTFVFADLGTKDRICCL